MNKRQEFAVVISDGGRVVKFATLDDYTTYLKAIISGRIEPLGSRDEINAVLLEDGHTILEFRPDGNLRWQYRQEH